MAKFANSSPGLPRKTSRDIDLEAFALSIYDSRTIQWRTTFVLEGSDSSTLKQQVDLPTSDTRKINQFYEARLARLERVCREQGTHPLYDYYIGYAAVQTGDKSAAVRHSNSS